MKNDFSMDEIRGFLRRFEEKNNLRTVVFVATGIAIIIFVIVFVAIKLKDRAIWGDYEDFDDDFDEFDYEDYNDEDEDEIMEDYHALDMDYEDEGEEV